jgi:hypothetical protein
MARPANEESPRWQRWLLFIRAVYDRTDLVEVKDVTLIPLPALWLGDFVEETGYPFIEQPSLPTVPSQIDVVQDALDVVPAPGMSDPDLGIKHEDGHWTVGE